MSVYLRAIPRRRVEKAADALGVDVDHILAVVEHLSLNLRAESPAPQVAFDDGIAEDLRLMASSGVTLAEAARRVGYRSHLTLERALRRHRMVVVYARLVANSRDRGESRDGRVLR